MDLSSILKGDEYRFINDDEHLGKHVILLGLAGSYCNGNVVEFCFAVFVLVRAYSPVLEILVPFVFSCSPQRTFGVCLCERRLCAASCCYGCLRFYIFRMEKTRDEMKIIQWYACSSGKR